MASDSSSASRAPVTASIVSVPLPSRMVCAVSRRSAGSQVRRAASQPRGDQHRRHADRRVERYPGTAQQDAVGADADRHDYAALLIQRDGAHPVLDAVDQNVLGTGRQPRQLKAALEHHLADDGDRPVVSTPRLGSLSCSGYMLASTMESSLRSNCAASLLASTTDVRTVNTATTAAAAAADASATRVRSEADRPNRGNRTYGSSRST